ncbi:phage tail tape measure protein [Parabacteroides goldsteinii]|jgi:TP901 family phage tail tape measure protein|uniref:phage tail tape measure protein n=1 Tax=Parabacteroides goldsteinii TaxID=328812 RepID=UPI001CCEC08C|nr:phage tail tape measure protein [Parabacteroides goldsteinii]UBD73587.1 phage tail tape measure protein [Parabacteroides goldsteinii]DAV61728.1 MAG TPA: tail tape measure protein [Caudoviricetes sp.]
MQPIQQTATTELIIDGERAKQELTLIEEKVKSVDKQIREARKTGDAQLVKSLKDQKNQLLANRKALQKEAIEVNRILNNLSTAKPKELNATIRELTRQLSDPKIKRGSQDWKFLNDQIRRCKKELSQVNAELQVGESRWTKANNLIGKYAGMIGTVIAVLTGITLAFSKFRQERDALEESAADLKALTGLDDDSIAWLKGQAQKLSTTVTEEGIRIRQSSTEILEAYKLVGSAKPELLGNKEALAEVTKQTLILASASGMRLVDAVDATTLALNQYGDGADQAARYTNALAAGSKYGSAAVESQTKAIKTSGVAAASAKIPIEQLIGTIETLGEKGIKDEIAGTGLKKFFLTLQTGSDTTNPKVVGLTQALENLSKQQMTAADIKAKFGEEGYNVASVLINEAEKVEYYTKAVTGTTVAIEQAVTKSETAAAKRDQAKNKLTELGIELIDQLNPAILSAMNLTTSWTKKLVNLISWISKNSSEIGLCAGAIAVYTIAVNSSVIADKAKALWTGKVITSVRKLYLLLASNPWVAVGTAIAAATIYLYKYVTQTSEAEKASREFRKELAQEQLEAGFLFDALKKANEGTDTRRKLIQTINEKYGQYLTNQLTEKSNWEDIDTALKQVNSSLETQIAMKMKTNAGSSITENYIDNVADKYDYIRKQVAGQSSEDIANIYVSDLKAMMQAGGKTAYEMFDELKGRYGNVLTSSAYRDLMRIKRLSDDYKQDMVELDQKFTFMTPPAHSESSGTGGSGGGSGEEEKKKSLLQIQKDLREEAEKMPETTEAEIAAKNRKIEVIDAEIARLKSLGNLKGTQAKQDKEEAKQKKALEKALKDSDQTFAVVKNAEKAKYYNQEIKNEALYNKHIEMIEMASLDNRIRLMKEHGQKSDAEEEKLMNKRIAFLKKYGKKLNFTDYIGDIKVEEEKEDPEVERLIERTKKSYEYKQAALLDQYEKGLITQKEYQEQERELQEEHLETMLSKQINYANQVAQIASQASQLVSKLSQSEELAIENKYAAQLKAAKGNAKKTAALEEQMEEEKKAVKKKYADIDFAITAAQIIATTSAAIMQLWVKPGFPAAIPLSVLVGATGVAQLALANKQRQQIKNLWTGGYTDQGPWDEPKGIVHSEEFVGNRFAVRNKAVNKVFKMIDVAQKNNTIATINETDIIRALGGLSVTNPGTNPVYQNTPTEPDPYITEALFLLSSTIKDLKKQMQEGTLARTYVTGDGGTKTARDKFDKLLKNVTRYTKKS